MAVNWHGDAKAAAIRRGMVRGLAIGIGIVEARAIYLITQTAKTGRIYRRRGVKHQASAPYQPFANDTGDTLKSRRVAVDAARLRATLFFHSLNAARLEHGTRKMKPRPFARRSLSETRAQVIDAIAIEVIKEL
jgi:hypothetical protein